MERTKVAILGAGFIANIHMESYARFIPEAEVVAVFSHIEDEVKTFAHTGIPQWYVDLSFLLIADSIALFGAEIQSRKSWKIGITDWDIRSTGRPGSFTVASENKSS